MNKTAQQFGTILISATLGVILLVSAFIPMVKSATDTVTSSDSLVYTFNDTVNASFTLTYDDLASLSIAGLTLNTNYTQDFDAGTVTILANTTATDNYTAAYAYKPASYLDDPGNRTLAAVLVIAGIIGLFYAMMAMFGLA